MLNLIKLENRIVLDGAGVGEAMDHAADHDAQVSTETHVPDHADEHDNEAATIAGAAALLAEQEAQAEAVDIILVSDSLPEYQTLVDAAKPGAQVIVYDADTESAQDVIGRVTDAAEESGQSVNSVTILSHGGSGTFNLGKDNITAENLDENSEAWAELKDVMTEDAHIYVYGCSVANESGDGQALLDGLAEATGADVFASDDTTGKEGDWDLEASSGADVEDISVPIHLESLADYSGQLVGVDADGDGYLDPFLNAEPFYGNAEDITSTFGVQVYVDKDITSPEDIYSVEFDTNDPVLADIKEQNLIIWDRIDDDNPDVLKYDGYGVWFVFVDYTPTKDLNTNDNGPATLTVTLKNNTTSAIIGKPIDVPLTVIGTNDAPELDDSAYMKMTPVEEDSQTEGDTVAVILNRVFDPTKDDDVLLDLKPIYDPDSETDADVREGIAVINVDDKTDGTWQYNTGSGWVDFGDNLSESNATVLAPDAKIRFIPNPNFYTDPAIANAESQDKEPNFTFLAWDQTDGSASGDTGVDTVRTYNILPKPQDRWAFSRASEIVSVSVTPVNDPPGQPNVPEDLGYTENGITIDNCDIIQGDGVPTPLQIELGTDVDDTQMTQVVIEITDGYQNDTQGKDTLTYSSETSGIEAQISEDGRIITFTATDGAANIADFQTAIDKVGFEHTGGDANGNNPIEGNRTIQVSVTDANSTGGDKFETSTATGTIFVDAINDEPVFESDYLTGNSLPAMSYTDKTAPINVLTGIDDLTIADVDDTVMTGAVIHIENYTQGDALNIGLTSGSGIQIVSNSDGTLELSGNASKAAYIAALKTVTYSNSINPGGVEKNISISVTDANSDGDGYWNPGGGDAVNCDTIGPGTATITRTISVNVPPQIDLNPTPGDGEPPGPTFPTTPGYVGPNDISVFFFENVDGKGCGPVFIADAQDGVPLIVESDGENIERLTVALSNPAPDNQDKLIFIDNNTTFSIVDNGIDITGDSQADIFVSSGNITQIDTNGDGQTDALGIEGEVKDGQLVLEFEGDASAAVYDSLLRSIAFANSSDNPLHGERTITVQASDVTHLESDVAISHVIVVPVNDAPENQAPEEVTVVKNIEFDFNEGDIITVGDLDVGSGNLQVTLSVTYGTISLDVPNDGNNSSEIVIIGTPDQINAQLEGLTYKPVTNFTGDDTLTITTNDLGNTGIDPDRVGVNCDVNTEGIINGDGVIVDPSTGNPIPGEPLDNQDTTNIIIHVTDSHHNVVPTGPETPIVPFLPITRGDGESFDGINQGYVRMPGPIGLTEGAGRPLSDMTPRSGEEFFDFCSIEEALRPHLGCRFANTKDADAQFSAVRWSDLTDLGWTRPYLNEEFDLYTNLFLRQEGDPGFNIPSGAFDVELGGQSDHKPQVFRDSGAEDFNDIGPGEIKKAFFAGREQLDRTGR